MSPSLGTDLCHIPRFEALLKKHGSQVLRKLFTSRELALAKDAGMFEDEAYWAKRFAAKEALGKALKTGLWREGIRFLDIEVLKEDSGAPYLVLSGEALVRYQKAEHAASAVSLSSDGDYALATVILW